MICTSRLLMAPRQAAICCSTVAHSLLFSSAERMPFTWPSMRFTRASRLRRSSLVCATVFSLTYYTEYSIDGPAVTSCSSCCALLLLFATRLTGPPARVQPTGSCPLWRLHAQAHRANHTRSLPAHRGVASRLCSVPFYLGRGSGQVCRRQSDPSRRSDRR